MGEQVQHTNSSP